MSQSPLAVPLVFVGGGTMARAIIHGATAAGLLSPDRVAVAEPADDRRASLQSWVGRVDRSIRDVMTWMAAVETPSARGQVVLAVKPQSLAAVAADLSPALASGPRRVIISILAGSNSSRIRAALGPAASVVRAMPNTPAQLRLGMTALALGAGAEPGDDRAAATLFSGVGDVVSIDESLMDAFTAVVGSGPAYLFYLAEAMARAAVELGFDPAMAARIVGQTLHGAASLLKASDADASRLRAAVTSTGGTTAAACAVLDQGGVMGVFVRAITAARDRGAELARL